MVKFLHQSSISLFDPLITQLKIVHQLRITDSTKTLLCLVSETLIASLLWKLHVQWIFTSVTHWLIQVNKGVEATLVQLLETGLLHADPHPGNLRYTSSGQIGYIYPFLIQSEWITVFIHQNDFKGFFFFFKFLLSLW